MTKEEYNFRRKELIKGFILSLDRDDVVLLYNAFCEETLDSEQTVYCNDEETFNDVFAKDKPFDIARSISNGGYDFYDRYFTIACDNVYSFDDPWDRNVSPIDIECLLRYDEGVLLSVMRRAILSYRDLEYDLDELEGEWQETEDKRKFKEEWNKMLTSKMPIILGRNGEYAYINYDESRNVLETGSVTNCGFCRNPFTVEVEVDYSEGGLNYYLEGLVEKYDELCEELDNVTEE